MLPRSFAGWVLEAAPILPLTSHASQRAAWTQVAAATQHLYKTAMFAVQAGNAWFLFHYLIQQSRNKSSLLIAASTQVSTALTGLDASWGGKEEWDTERLF